MIKKAFLALLTSVSLITYAQDTEEELDSVESTEETTSEFKPAAGEVSIDFTANNLFKFFNNSPVFSLSDDAQGFGGGIRARYFVTPDIAARTNIITEYTYYSAFPLTSDPLGNGNDGVDEANEIDGISGFHKQKYSHFSISIGAEKHFSGTKRLDTYAGAEFVFDKVSISEKLENMTKGGTYSEGYQAEADGAYLNQEYINLSNFSNIRNAAGTAIGARLLVGADYYVFPKVYLGAELGLSIMQKWVEDYKMMEVIPETSTEIVKTVSNRGNAVNIGQDVNAQFRLGFRL